MQKIITLISIWYVFWFLFSIILIRLRMKIPEFKIERFDLIGNNIYIFIPSFLYLVWKYVL